MSSDNEKQRSSKRLISRMVVIGLIVVLLSVVGWLWLSPDKVVLKDTGHTVSPFSLEDVHADTAYQSDNGKVKLITFFLINCPDGVCQMTMLDFTDLQESLKEEGWFGEEVELLAVTFDPERDDRSRLQQFSESFQADPAGWKFLRGSTDEIESVTGDFKFSFHLDEEGNAVHPTTMYLVDEAHNVRAYHKMSTSEAPMDQERIMDGIEYLLKDR